VRDAESRRESLGLRSLACAGRADQQKSHLVTFAAPWSITVRLGGIREPACTCPPFRTGRAVARGTCSCTLRSHEGSDGLRGAPTAPGAATLPDFRLCTDALSTADVYARRWYSEKMAHGFHLRAFLSAARGAGWP
jgi:hypothetical protein